MTEYPGLAVRALIRDSQERILLLRRQNTRYYDGQWCLPGGKVEYGQTLEEAVVREVLEETALTCLNSDYLFFANLCRAGRTICITSHFIFAAALQERWR